MPEDNRELPSDPLWYKDAIFYELRVRSLYDSNGDGIGDFPGLTEKLDYFKELGVTTLWLLPFYPSPMRDDGYDTADYFDVHPDCGTLEDFKVFLREAHLRGLRVVTELVLNHTSDQHPWFQRARRAPPGSSYRDFYVWSDTPDRYTEARIIFKDFETSNWSWDPVGKAYYWHRFYAHQPDLNFENPSVKEALLRVVDFWFTLGVDGLRLDAVPYLYEREGTNCENLPETYTFLRELRAHVDAHFKDRMLLAEANQWPEDAVQYFDDGRACHMAFHFPIMPRLFMSVRTEDRFPLTDIWSQTPPIHESSQWALFLRNHDELTLEMVTDEERDYMYRAYAHESRMRINLGIRRRLAPLLGNNRRTIELMNALLLSLPGTPVLYYGDEIGMGDNVYLGDRDGVRTPMQWSGDRNAGFSRANPQRLILPVIIDHEYHYQTVNVEGQDANRHSLLWWMRRLISLRKQFRAFGRGSIEFLDPANPRVLAFVRCYQDERILVVANLSRFVQFAELNLAKYKGSIPVELFGRASFPAVGEAPYLLTLGSHVFYWFSLAPSGAASMLTGYRPPRVRARGEFRALMDPRERWRLEQILPAYLSTCRWFPGAGLQLKTVRIVELLPVGQGASRAPQASGPTSPVILVLELEYGQGEPERWSLPVSFVTGDQARELSLRTPERVIAELTLEEPAGNREGILVDAVGDPEFGARILETLTGQRRLRGERGEAFATTTTAYGSIVEGDVSALAVRPLRPEQGHSSIVYGEKVILKWLRRFDESPSPVLEMGRFLLQAQFGGTPRLAAALEYGSGRQPPTTLAVVHEFVHHQVDALGYTRDELRRYFERAAAKREWGTLPPARPLGELIDDSAPNAAITNLVGAYLEAARLLGRRTAELHLALASGEQDSDFAPEPYATLYQRSMYQSMRNVSGRVLRHVETRLASLPEAARAPAAKLLEQRERMAKVFEAFLRRKVGSRRIRCHGDLHLARFLYTGRDFVVVDMEGEIARPITERRRKRSALRDVAVMVCSFHDTALAELFTLLESGALGERDLGSIEPFANLFWTWSSWSYLKGYLERVERAPFAPSDRDELRILLDAFRLERALRQLERDLHQDPARVRIALHGIEQILWRGEP
jgi:maltose alpha-D-glucosyltransferase/alpha-amylase